MKYGSWFLRASLSTVLLVQASCATTVRTSSGGSVTRASLISGHLQASDYPLEANGAQGVVKMRLSVSVEGRVTSCAVIGSSGSPELDRGTCELVRERFRYSPARDAQGRPIASHVGWQQRWWQEFRKSKSD